MRQATRVLPVILEDFVPNLLRNPRAMVRVANLARRADLRTELEELRASGHADHGAVGDAGRHHPPRVVRGPVRRRRVEGTVVEGSHSWLLADPDQFGEVMTNDLQVANAVARELERSLGEGRGRATRAAARRTRRRSLDEITLGG